MDEKMTQEIEKMELVETISELRNKAEREIN